MKPKQGGGSEERKGGGSKVERTDETKEGGREAGRRT